jgi:hypothetical protein
VRFWFLVCRSPSRMSSRRGGRGTRKHDRDKEEQGGQAKIGSQRMRLCEVGGYESERRVKAYDLGRERDAGDRSASVVGGEEEALSKRCVDKGKQMNETKLQSHYITPAIEYGRDERTNERTDTLTLSRLYILHFFSFFSLQGYLRRVPKRYDQRLSYRSKRFVRPCFPPPFLPFSSLPLLLPLFTSPSNQTES